MEDHQYAWILWYIWKGRNNKVLSNLDVEPRATLKLAQTVSLFWAEAQNSLTKGINHLHPPAKVISSSISGRCCFTDDSCKDQNVFSGQEWYSTLEGFDGLMGASQSPLHSEIEALKWEMECMRNLRQLSVTFATYCSQLVKMISVPEEWPAFANYLEDLKCLKRSFISSELIHIPRTHNLMADSLARSARKQPSFVVHMDAELTV